MVQGSCLCAGIEFQIHEEKIMMMNNCHCTSCRKVSGAAYATFIQVPPEYFTWLSGEELVATYESSPGNHRAFCGTCGSRMPQSNSAWPMITIPAGSLDADPNVLPQVNTFTASKEPWYSIDESIPSCTDMGTPEFWGEVLEKLEADSKT